MSKIEFVTTPAIASNTATIESDVCDGLVMEWRVDVLTSAGAASGSTCTVTITDNVFGRTLLVKTGVTGVGNFFDPSVVWTDTAAVATTTPKPFCLVGQRFTVTITSGTNTNFVRVWGKILG